MGGTKKSPENLEIGNLKEMRNSSTQRTYIHAELCGEGWGREASLWRCGCETLAGLGDGCGGEH